MYSNGTEFCFIRSYNDGLDETLKKLKAIQQGLIDRKPYTLDWADIIKRYGLHCHGGDIDEFSHCHVHSLSLLGNFSSDDAQKEAMYMEIRSGLLDKRADGEIE